MSRQNNEQRGILLGTVSQLAEWAAFNRCQEIYDACGEIFEKLSHSVEATSTLGLRLAIFLMDSKLSELTTEVHTFHELLSIIENIVSSLLAYLPSMFSH